VSDHDALVRAVCAAPDDDTPRLVYADYLDDDGEADRAAFVRAQVELARTPGWEPFAVSCRHRTTAWAEPGAPFRESLPPLPPGWNVAWHERAFRRGLGWRLTVGSLHAWDELAPALFERAPVGELHLRAPATLDDWRRFAAADWVANLRAVHLEAGSPVEPVRALCGADAATGITALFFHIAVSAGLPVLAADLFATPLGRGLRRVGFRLGQYVWLEELLDVLAAGPPGLTALDLEAMGLTPALVRRWCAAGGPARLTALDLKDNYALGNDGVRALAAGLRAPTLEALGLAGAGAAGVGAKALAECPGLAGVRALDLSRNTFAPAAVRVLAGSPHLAGVRSLNLSRCQLGDLAVRRLVRAHFWPKLVELDLRDNPITDPGARHLLAADVPPDLTALLLDGARLGRDVRAALGRHFGAAAILG